MKLRVWLGTAVAIGGGVTLALAGASPAPAVVPAPLAAATPTHSSTTAPVPTPTSAPTSIPTSTSIPTTPSGTSTSTTGSAGLLFVANADSGPVTAYNVDSMGAVLPSRTVASPNNPSTVWDPWGVAFDGSGNLFVQSFLSDATTFVFPPGAGATTPPSRIFQANAPDNSSIAVGADGYEYVVGGESGPTIAVEPPGAAGAPGNLYHVAPVRTIPLTGGFNPWPSTLSVDGQNEVLAAVTGPQGNAIEVFTGGAGGGAAPVRVISGPDTGLGACGSPCSELSVTYSPFTGRIYTAVSDGASTRINVFAGNASGDAQPLQTLQGPTTGLAGKVVTGLTVSQTDGTIFALVKNSQFGTGQIDAFARLAQGDTAPLRSFTDAESGFADATGIALSR